MRKSVVLSLVVACSTLLSAACGDDKPSARQQAGSSGVAGSEGGEASGGSGDGGSSAAAGSSSITAGSGGDIGPGGNGGDGGSAGSGGMAGSAGMGGSTVVPPQPGQSGFGLVGAGTYSKSASYRLVGSVGDSPGASHRSSSTNYVLHGGLVGTTQP